VGGDASATVNTQWGMLDIGANIGTITVPAAQIIRQFGFGSVTAVEALPLHVLLLRKSIVQNNLTNILVIRHAISNETGLHVQFRISSQNRGGASVSGSQLKDFGNAETSAVTVTLDQLYAFYPKRLKNTLIWKIDIECYEGYLFSGASKFLEEVRPCWIIAELFEDCLNNNGPMKYQEIISLLLEKYGYLSYSPGHIFLHENCCKPGEGCIFK